MLQFLQLNKKGFKMQTVTTKIGSSIRTRNASGISEFFTVEATGGEIGLFKQGDCKHTRANKIDENGARYFTFRKIKFVIEEVQND